MMQRPVVMLCSRLGLGDGGESRIVAADSQRWNALARRIHDSELNGPGALLGVSAADISKRLEVPMSKPEKLAMLLGSRLEPLRWRWNNCPRQVSGA
jgi:hypothetical protein